MVSLNVHPIPQSEPDGFNENTGFIEGPELGPDFLVCPLNLSHSIKEVWSSNSASNYAWRLGMMGGGVTDMMLNGVSSLWWEIPDPIQGKG